MGEVVIPSKPLASRQTLHPLTRFTDILYPEWKVDTSFINEHLTRALQLDAKLSSHPIEVACPDANKANQIFDSLSYSKAGSVLRMLSDYVGEEVFLKGVSIYLKKHLYGNTVSQDLWDGISEAAGHDVGKMMQTWVGKIRH
jgi:aminopeptidase 2